MITRNPLDLRWCFWKLNSTRTSVKKRTVSVGSIHVILFVCSFVSNRQLTTRTRRAGSRGEGELRHLPRKFWSGSAKLQKKLCIYINSFYSFYNKSIIRITISIFIWLIGYNNNGKSQKPNGYYLFTKCIFCDSL
jgi:hypothetical protein